MRIAKHREKIYKNPTMFRRWWFFQGFFYWKVSIQVDHYIRIICSLCALYVWNERGSSYFLVMLFFVKFINKVTMRQYMRCYWDATDCRQSLSCRDWRAEIGCYWTGTVKHWQVHALTIYFSLVNLFSFLCSYFIRNYII